RRGLSLPQKAGLRPPSYWSRTPTRSVGYAKRAWGGLATPAQAGGAGWGPCLVLCLKKSGPPTPDPLPATLRVGGGEPKHLCSVDQPPILGANHHKTRRRSMDPTRRTMMAAGSAALAVAAASPQALGRYPDPAVEVLDPSFAKYRLFNAALEQLASGMRWS